MSPPLVDELMVHIHAGRVNKHAQNKKDVDRFVKIKYILTMEDRQMDSCKSKKMEILTEELEEMLIESGEVSRLAIRAIISAFRYGVMVGAADTEGMQDSAADILAPCVRDSAAFAGRMDIVDARLMQ